MNTSCGSYAGAPVPALPRRCTPPGRSAPAPRAAPPGSRRHPAGRPPRRCGATAGSDALLQTWRSGVEDDRRDRKTEFAPRSTPFTPNRDRPAVGFDERLCNRQPQAQPSSPRGLLSLAVGCKQPLGVLRIDADTRIPHGDASLVVVIPLHRHAHRPGLGVGHGVPQEVFENLRQALRVGVHQASVRRGCRSRAPAPWLRPAPARPRARRQPARSSSSV